MEKYSLNIIWSKEDESYVATVPEFPGLSAFGDTADEAVHEAMVALQGFIEVYKEDGCSLPEPNILESYSGQTRIRLPKSLHAKLAGQAKREGISLNAYMVQLISENHISHMVEQKLEHIEKMVEKAAIIQNTSSLGSDSFKMNYINNDRSSQVSFLKVV